jgi:hypothetical protein
VRRSGVRLSSFGSLTENCLVFIDHFVSEIIGQQISRSLSRNGRWLLTASSGVIASRVIDELGGGDHIELGDRNIGWAIGDVVRRVN